MCQLFADLLWTCYGETGVMNFGLNRATWCWFTCKWDAAADQSATVYLHPDFYNIQGEVKMYPLKLLAIFWATACNFDAKFHTLITCSHLHKSTKRHIDIWHSPIVAKLRDLLRAQWFCTFKNLVLYVMSNACWKQVSTMKLLMTSDWRKLYKQNL